MKQNYIELFYLLLSEMGIKEVEFYTMGNSIAAGGSLWNGITPLLERNEDVSRLANKHGIILTKKELTYFRKNADHIIARSYHEDLTMMELHQRKINNINKYPERIILTSNDLSNLYEDKLLSEESRFKSSLEEPTNNLKICLYSGLTGSILDATIPDRKLNFINGIKDDKRELVSFLTYLNTISYNKALDLQTYVLEVPEIFPFNIPIKLLNKILEGNIKEIENVEIVKCLKTSTKKKGNILDIHPDKDEYLTIINQIFEKLFISVLGQNYFLKTSRRLMQHDDLINKKFNFDTIKDLRKYPSLYNKSKDKVKYILSEEFISLDNINDTIGNFDTRNLKLNGLKSLINFSQKLHATRMRYIDQTQIMQLLVEQTDKIKQR